MKEILPDGVNMVDDNGDVVPVDHDPIPRSSEWYDDSTDVVVGGASVDLAVRALALSIALDKYAHSNKLRGFNKTDKPVDRSQVGDIRRKSWQDGDNALKEAYGYKQMVEDGHSAVDVNDDFVAVRFQFKAELLDPNDPKAASRRKKLRKKLQER